MLTTISNRTLAAICILIAFIVLQICAVIRVRRDRKSKDRAKTGPMNKR